MLFLTRPHPGGSCSTSANLCRTIGAGKIPFIVLCECSAAGTGLALCAIWLGDVLILGI